MCKNILIKTISGCLLFLFLFAACTKFTQIAPPKNQLTGKDAFNSDSSALSALTGIYYLMNISSIGFGQETFYMGLSADELNKINPSDDFLQIQSNQVVSNNTTLATLWNSVYKVIGQANACLEGVNASTGLSAGIADEITGEALFLRSFCYFYLVNQYGDVPLVVSTDWATTSRMTRTPAAEVYSQMINDLITAKSLLQETSKIRASRLAATALLARVYLYNNDFVNAEKQATEVIDDPSMPDPLPALDQVFLAWSPEAIWQLQTSAQQGYVAEASSFIPYDFPWFVPNYSITDELLASFETGDRRKDEWLGVKEYESQLYYYPYKYRSNSTAGPAEYYDLLRLAEQYLIRAEANARKASPDIKAAVADINKVRERAGLSDLPDDISKEACISAIEQENRVEFFTECGHRWLDLKRTGRVDDVMSATKSTWVSTAALYPVPDKERKNNNKLSQNDGYY